MDTTTLADTARTALFTAAALLALGAGTALASPCYEWVDTEPGMVCDGQRSGNSADFVGACSFHPGGPVQVEVECPAARWMNVTNAHGSSSSNSNLVHATACSVFGMTPAAIDGQICASGVNRPTTGEGWWEIDYRHGVQGNPGRGATVLNVTEPPIPWMICLTPAEVADRTFTAAKIAVAVACQP